MEQSTAVMLILILLTLALLFGVFSIIQQTVDAETEKRACQLSIQRTLFVQSNVGFLNPFNIECSRRIISVNEQEAVILANKQFDALSSAQTYSYFVRTENGVRAQQITSENYQEELKQAISYEMAECWDTFTRGNQDPLSSDSWAAIPANTCFICAEFHFSNSPETEIAIQEHLQENNHHFLDQTARRYPTFDDFLYGMPTQANANTCNQEGYVGEKTLTASNQEPLAVVYYKRGAKTVNVANSCQAVAVTPISQIPQECFAII